MNFNFCSGMTYYPKSNSYTVVGKRKTKSWNLINEKHNSTYATQVKTHIESIGRYYKTRIPKKN